MNKDETNKQGRKTVRSDGPEFDAALGYADVDSADEEYRLRLDDYKRTGSFRDKQAAVAALNALEEALCGHNPHTIAHERPPA
jgi:hypothetical protein